MTNTKEKNFIELSSINEVTITADQHDHQINLYPESLHENTQINSSELLNEYKKLDQAIDAINQELQAIINNNEIPHHQLSQRIRNIQGYINYLTQLTTYGKFNQGFGYELDNSNNTDTAEKALLHLCLMDYNNYETALSLLTSSDFFYHKHQELFELIGKLYEQYNYLNLNYEAIIFHINEMPDRKGIKRIELIGGADYLYSVYYYTAIFDNFDVYIKTLIKQRIRRNLHQISHDILQNINQPGLDLETLISGYQDRLSDFNMQTDASYAIELARIDNVVKRLIENLTNDDLNERERSANTPFYALNDAIKAFKPGSLVIIAGRPAMGKSTFAMNICTHNAISRFNKTDNHDALPVIVFSLEMKAEEIGIRFLAEHHAIDMEILIKGDLSPQHLEKIESFRNLVTTNTNFYIFDQFGITIEQIRARIRKVASEYDGKVGLVMIDYIQLINTNHKFNNRNDLVGHFSRELKIMSHEFSCPVIALSQLSRAGENRGEDSPPINSDLRDSGSLEQDADMVIMVHRPRIKKDSSAENEETEKYQGQGKPAQIIITKNRNGPTGTAHIGFEGQYARFIDHVGRKFERD